MYIYIRIYVILKEISSAVYLRTSFVSTHGIGHMMPQGQCDDNQRVHCFHDSIYIYGNTFDIKKESYGQCNFAYLIQVGTKKEAYGKHMYMFKNKNYSYL